MDQLSLREKSVLSGLYLSKFDTEGLHYLGFDTFTEAFNVIGHSLGVRPASVKNYRDEFDPLFPNDRQGWHKRPIREYCKAVYDTFNDLQLDAFAKLLKEAVYKDHAIDVLMEEVARKAGAEEESFAKRLITRQAAEQYFKSVYKGIEVFSGFTIEDTTKLGCGFDFRLVSSDIFYGVEVKGLNEASGSIALTDKEHSVATLLKSRYFLFVVKNFREEPFHEMYQDPLSGKLTFNRVEQRTVEISWTTRV
jgi:hypothetical protein